MAEREHFGRAAKACGISQPTLSVQIRKLEEPLGVELFKRASKTVAPTSACERLRAYDLDAALRGTQVDGTDLASLPLFVEPFLAALSSSRCAPWCSR